jgi:hypothetical protein
MPGDGPGRDDGGGEEAGWAWELLSSSANMRMCCYNITLPGVHGSIASRGIASKGRVRGPSVGGGVPDARSASACTSA